MSRALGRYELLRPLARGGMGEVYLARRRAAGVEKWLVVKRMRPERAGDTRFLELFMREARLTMSLTHQNIVPVFDFGRIDDQVFLAMERIEGKDLGSSLTKSELLTPGKGLQPLLAAFLAHECLQALDYAHRRKGPDGADLGIVHRDVTPRNVLLSWAGEVKLTDFGIAVLAGDANTKATGTPAYMAPEQARGEPLDVRADIYAVGLILREALTGQRARRGNEKEGVLELAQKGELDPWPEGINATLRAIADKATQADKTQRYADARAMLEELDGFMVAERAANKAETPTRQLASWLDETWKGQREDEDNIDAKIDADVLVSFLDDGALDVIGTGTQRSALATAADESEGAEPAKVDAKAEASGPTRAKTPTAQPRTKSPTAQPTRAPTEQPTRAPTEQPSELAEPSKRAQTEHVVASERPRRSALVLVLFGALVVAGVVIFMLSRRRTEQQPVAQRDATIAIPEAVIDAVMATAEPDTAEIPADATVEVATLTPDAAVDKRGSGSTNVRPPRDTRDAGTGSAGSAAVVVEPPKAGTRKVTINSKPVWSNWTVDGGPQHSGVEQIDLTPGKHTIHFTGNPYFKADKTVTIDVPDRDGFTHVETLEQQP